MHTRKRSRPIFCCDSSETGTYESSAGQVLAGRLRRVTENARRYHKDRKKIRIKLSFISYHLSAIPNVPHATRTFDRFPRISVCIGGVPLRKQFAVSRGRDRRSECKSWTCLEGKSQF